jgi:HK97 family phage prohead protease
VKHHNFGLKIKSIDETGSGSFVGLGAAYNNVDLGGDQILPGAFARTLAATKTFPLLWQHQSDNPIGTVTVTDSPQGLIVSGQLLMDLDQAKRAYLLIKAKVIKGLSIGFECIQESFSDGVRQLKELRLWEISICTFPMNEEAVISSVKAMTDDERGKHLRAINVHRKAIDMHQRKMRDHLKAMFDDAFDDSDDDEDPDNPEPTGDVDDDQDQEMNR